MKIWSSLKYRPSSFSWLSRKYMNRIAGPITLLQSFLHAKISTRWAGLRGFKTNTDFCTLDQYLLLRKRNRVLWAVTPFHSYHSSSSLHTLNFVTDSVPLMLEPCIHHSVPCSNFILMLPLLNPYSHDICWISAFEVEGRDRHHSVITNFDSRKDIVTSVHHPATFAAQIYSYYLWIFHWCWINSVTCIVVCLLYSWHFFDEGSLKLYNYGNGAAFSFAAIFWVFYFLWFIQHSMCVDSHYYLRLQNFWRSFFPLDQNSIYEYCLLWWLCNDVVTWYTETSSNRLSPSPCPHINSWPCP